MLNVNVDLNDTVEQEFNELKTKLGFENNTEVLRWAIKYTNARYRLKK